MKKYISVFIATVILMGAMASGGYAREQSKTAPAVQMLDDKIIKQLEESGAPAQEHLMLSALAGTWYYTVKYWTDEKTAEPQISSGLMTNKMALNDRFLHSETHLILNIGGQNIPYEGWGMLGYDTEEKVYTSVWFDNMRTGIMTGKGSYNEERKTIEEKGSFTHPLLKGAQTYRAVLQFIDEESYKRTLFITNKSKKEFKVLEIELSRR